MEYLQNILEVERKGRKHVQIDEELLKLNIKLLCQLHPEEVIDELKLHNEYSLDDIIPICREHNATEALAFLLERSGAIKEVVELRVKDLQMRSGGMSRVKICAQFYLGSTLPVFRPDLRLVRTQLQVWRDRWDLECVCEEHSNPRIQSCYTEGGIPRVLEYFVQSMGGEYEFGEVLGSHNNEICLLEFFGH